MEKSKLSTTQLYLNHYGLNINQFFKLKEYHKFINDASGSEEYITNQINQFIETEKKLSNEFYTFYTSIIPSIVFYYDVMKIVHEIQTSNMLPLQKLPYHKKKMRLNNINNVNDFLSLLNENYPDGPGNSGESDKIYWDDTIKLFQQHGIPVNLNLFSHHTADGETSLSFFFKGTNFTTNNFMDVLYDNIFKPLNINEQSFKKYVMLFDAYYGNYKYGILHQINIRKDAIKNIGYICTKVGLPLNVDINEILDLYQMGNFNEVNKIISKKLFDMDNEYIKKLFRPQVTENNISNIFSQIQARIIYSDEHFLDKNDIMIFENNIPDFDKDKYYDELYNYIVNDLHNHN